MPVKSLKQQRKFSQHFLELPKARRKDLLRRQLADAKRLAAIDGRITRILLGAWRNKKKFSQKEVNKLSKQVHCYHVLAGRLLLHDNAVFEDSLHKRLNGNQKGRYELRIHNVIHKQAGVASLASTLVKDGLLTEAQAKKLLFS